MLKALLICIWFFEKDFGSWNEIFSSWEETFSSWKKISVFVFAFGSPFERLVSCRSYFPLEVLSQKDVLKNIPTRDS